MSRISDGRLEAAVRDVLAHVRTAGGAPAELRAAIERVPTESRPSRIPARTRIAISLAGWFAGASVAVVVGFFVAARTMNLPVVPYANPGLGSPTPAAYDPEIVGPGIVTTVAPLQGWLPWLVAVLGWIVLASVAQRAWRHRRPVIAFALALALGLGFGAFEVATHPGLTFGGAYGPVSGLDVTAEPPRASNGPSVWYVTAEKGAPFVFAITLTNPGPLPLRFLGIYEPAPLRVHYYRWSAVWQVDNSYGGVPPPADATAFHPVDVAPSEFVTIYLVGRASDCAYGHGFRLEDADQFGFSSRDSFSVAYSVAGLTSIAVIELPSVIAEPVLGNCPPA